MYDAHFLLGICIGISICALLESLFNGGGGSIVSKGLLPVAIVIMVMMFKQGKIGF